MRRQTTLKSDTCTEDVAVNAADISVKVKVPYLGRTRNLPLATIVVKRQDIFREFSRGHSSLSTRGEGLNY